MVEHNRVLQIGDCIEWAIEEKEYSSAVGINGGKQVRLEASCQI